eukprot:15473885-Alexandrium_andersonii.AAC.1
MPQPQETWRRWGGQQLPTGRGSARRRHRRRPPDGGRAGCSPVRQIPGPAVEGNHVPRPADRQDRRGRGGDEGVSALGG